MAEKSYSGFYKPSKCANCDRKGDIFRLTSAGKWECEKCYYVHQREDAKA